MASISRSTASTAPARTKSFTLRHEVVAGVDGAIERAQVSAHLAGPA
jgi:hypothetical protein